MQRIGVDTLGIERMALALRRSGHGFLAKSFTAAEISYCAGVAEKLAGRWAAKEAVIKCFDGTGICFPRRRIEILPAASGAPRVSLLEGDAQGAVLQVSITHQAGIAVATAVLEMPDPGEQALRSPAAVRLPIRAADSHKGTYGSVLVLGGSIGFTGAPYLSAMGAARSGAGKVRILVGETIYPILAAKATEVMVLPMAEAAPGAVGHSALEAVERQFAEVTAGVIGPGLGRDSSSWRLVLELVARVGCPLVIDADGLNALARHPESLVKLGANRILTPHPGEMSSLTGRPVREIQADRSDVAAGAAREWGAIVVLKGAHTVVAAPDGRLSVDPHEVPALASGGTGDVLSGLIAGLLAQGLEPFEAAVTGVFVHAAAGRRIAARIGDSGLLAGDLLVEIPLAMKGRRRGDGR